MPDALDAPVPPADDDGPPSSFVGDRGSSRSLDEVGAFAVLGAMVEQRRRASSIPPPAELDEVAHPAVAPRSPDVEPNDDVFQKNR